MLAEHAADLANGEERDQGDRQDAPDAESDCQFTAADMRQRLGDALALPDCGDRFFQDMEQKEDNGENDSFVDDWVNQWSGLESLSQLQILYDQHNLGEDGSIYQCETVRQITHVSHNDRLIQRKQTKNDPEINEHDRKALEFMNASGLQIVQTIVRSSHLIARHL